MNIDYHSSIGETRRIDINPPNLVYDEPKPFSAEDESLHSQGQTILQHFNRLNIQSHLKGVMMTREFLSIIDFVETRILLCINLEIVEHCVRFLECSECPSIQFESAWVLNNIACGEPENAESVIDKGAIPPLLELLKSDKANIVEQSVLTIANCLGDDTHKAERARELVLLEGMPLIIDIFRRFSTQIPVLRSACLAIVNVLGYRTQRLSEYNNCVVMLLPILTDLLQMEQFIVVEEVCCALCWIVSKNNDYEPDEKYARFERIDIVMQSEITPRVIQLLCSTDFKVVRSSLRVIGNMSSGTVTQIEQLIRQGILPIMNKLIGRQDANICIDVSWIVANVCTGTVEQIEEVFKAKIVQLLVGLLRKDNVALKNETLTAIYNIVLYGSVKQRITLCKDHNLIYQLFYNLSVQKESTILLILQIVEKMLHDEESDGPKLEIVFFIHKSDALIKIERLQRFNNGKVQQLARQIMGKYFRDRVHAALHTGHVLCENSAC